MTLTMGDVIRKLRKERRMSLRALERESRVNRITISKIERGASNSQRETIDALARALGTTMVQLEAEVSGVPVPPTPHRPGELPPEWENFARRVARLAQLHPHLEPLFYALLACLEDKREAPTSHIQ